MIALIAAVPFETRILQTLFSTCEIKQSGGYDFYQGNLLGHDVTMLHSGVGKANAAAATAFSLSICTPSIVVAAGCAGAYPGAGLSVGDLALATEEIYGDEGAATPEGFWDMEALDLPLLQCHGRKFFNRFPSDQLMTDLARPLLKKVAAKNNRKLVAGPFVTVSTCSGTNKAGEQMAIRTGGVCENMEGAAIAQVCALNNIPFLEIRGISNLTEDRDMERWDLKEAAEIAQSAVQAFLANWKESS